MKYQSYKEPQLPNVSPVLPLFARQPRLGWNRMKPIRLALATWSAASLVTSAAAQPAVTPDSPVVDLDEYGLHALADLQRRLDIGHRSHHRTDGGQEPGAGPHVRSTQGHRARVGGWGLVVRRRQVVVPYYPGAVYYLSGENSSASVQPRHGVL